MHSARTLGRLAIAGLALTSLSACSNASEPDTEAWVTAIEDVPGVTSAEVEFTEYTSGEAADVDVYTDTNDPEELERILRESAREFVEASGDTSTFGLEFGVWRMDRTSGLDPESIGWNGTTIGLLRDDLAADQGS